jgi:hypothetical protein
MDAHLDLLELDAARTGPRPAHLDACAACRATFDTLRRLETRLAAPAVAVPPMVRARILRKPARRWAPMAAAAALFLSLATLFFAAPRPSRDIVDAYLIASGLRADDVNGDGRVDRRDAEALAREVVSIGGGAAR